MGLFDKVALIGKAKKLAEAHADKVSAAIDKVADVVDDKTGGKYADKIDKGAKAAKGFIDADGRQASVDGDTPTPDADAVAVGSDPAGPTPATRVEQVTVDPDVATPTPTPESPVVAPPVAGSPPPPPAAL